MLTSDLTSLVPLQFSPWLQVRKIGTIHLSIYLSEMVDRGLLLDRLKVYGVAGETMKWF